MKSDSRLLIIKPSNVTGIWDLTYSYVKDGKVVRSVKTGRKFRAATEHDKDNTTKRISMFEPSDFSTIQLVEIKK